MLPIAHVGHWALWILYAVPVIVVLASIVVTVLRDRREGRVSNDPPRPEPAATPRTPSP